MSLLIIILAVFVILTFVVGVSFLFGGYCVLPDNSKLAPLPEFQKAQADLKLANAEMEKLRQQANTLAVELDGMKDKCHWAEENVKNLEALSKQGSQAQMRIDQLEKDLSFLSQKADSQAQEAIDVITRLAAEGEALQNAFSQNNNAAKTEDLNNLTDENQKLKIQVEGYAGKVKDLEVLAASCAEDKSKLLAVEDQLKEIRVRSEEQIVQANAALVKFNSDIELLNTQITEKDERIKKFSQELLASRQEAALFLKGIDDLKAVQKTVSISHSEDLDKQLEQLQAANQHLRDKEKMLTFKLAQARAQAMSFERICEEFKCQVGGR